MLTAIRVNELGKRYRLHHIAESGNTYHRYTALRDVITDKVKSMARRARGREEGRASRSVDDFWALKDVSFDVQAGECVGIIGRNGAGKSTLLKILSRISEPTTGRIEIRGRVASLLEVGTGFHPELTGRENIFLNGAILGMTRAEMRRKFDAIVAFAEVERFLDTPVKRYSSGMYVRLAFAVAAHLEPEILIVDEVLAVGDAEFQKKCLGKMEEVGRGGRTVLFVSHNMASVARLCRRAVLLQAGRVAEDGASEDVVRAYLNAGVTTTAERTWPNSENAPGNAFVRMKSVRVRNQRTGELSDAIDIRHPIEIEVEYLNTSNVAGVNVALEIFDENSQCLFATGDYVNPAWRKAPRDFNGAVRCTCTIPGNMFAEGQFRVQVAFVTHIPNEVIWVERDVVSFMVVDHSEGDGARGVYAGRFPGLMRPLLDWKVERLAP